MADPQQSPPGGVTPHITIGHGKAAAAVEFYKAAFGAEEAMRHMAEDGQRIMHCHLKLNRGSLMLNDHFAEYSPGGYTEPAACTLHLQVDDADAWWRRALQAGARVRMELADQFWGDRYGLIDDPFGFTWSIGGPIKT